MRRGDGGEGGREANAADTPRPNKARGARWADHFEIMSGKSFRDLHGKSG